MLDKEHMHELCRAITSHTKYPTDRTAPPED